ncbi:MAG: glucokinase, partial [Gammaproteobacteria bacterium]
GGTNTRLALVAEGTCWEHLQTWRNDDFESPEEIVARYLQAHKTEPDAAAFAVAGPVRDGEATLTNRGWKISARALADRFGLEHCEVVNDFSGVALGVPALAPDEVEQAGGAQADAAAPIAILGPGTGLGVGGLVPTDAGGRVLVTEGGHATLAPIDARSAAIIERLRVRFGHVSLERAISGQGMENIYRAIGELDGKKPEPPDAAAIGKAAAAGDDAAAAETLAHFFALLGAAAGDLALSYGAFGGVYIAGGIVPRYLENFRRSGFRAAFESKGRMSDYVKTIPVFVILHEEVELLGLAASLDARANGKPWPRV